MSCSSFRWPERPSGLYRDPDHGKIAGVCAGLGAYFAVRPKFIRLAMILGCVFGLFIPIVVGYVLLTLLLPTASEVSAAERALAGAARRSGPWNPPDPGEPTSEERIERLKERFRGLDRRLAGIETQVTSAEFQLRQKFRDL
jgi:phage shock protein C